MDAPELNVIATGLMFPEGPIAMADGSVLVVEIARGTLSRVAPNGQVEVVATTGGGPNGAAMGPDGKCYVCNNGGFEWTERNGRLHVGGQAKDYAGGSIQRVDLDSGAVETLYTRANGVQLRGPNDLVFDASGGFWFTDHGKTRERERDRTGVFYAKADGSHIEEAIFPLEAPNGIGLSPNEDEVYVAETPTGRLWAFPLSEPGRLARRRADRGDGGRLVTPARQGFYLFDSLAVDAEGNVCVATLMDGGVTVLSPAGDEPRFVPMPDRFTTNICFGGPDLRTAYVTLSGSGRLASLEWPTPGLALNYLNK